MRRATSPRRWLAHLGVVATVVAAAATTFAPPAIAEGTIVGADRPDAVPGRYIVVLDGDAAGSSAQAAAGRMATRYGVTVEHTYGHALHGFAGRMSEAAARRLAAAPGVAYVEQDHMVSTMDIQQPPPSWGLNRVDQKRPPLDNSYAALTRATNVRAYVIDTGIRTSHGTFGGRATWGTNTTGDGNNSDCHGHGTHVAGTIGGSQYGVAKGVQLTAVKVIGCSGRGPISDIAAGVDWVTAHHSAGTPAVANMSLGAATTSSVLESAVRNSIADGIVYTISSGNDNRDACNYTPARVSQAITVNATRLPLLVTTDTRADFSNWGTCTDIFAPGVDIVSAWNTSNTATNTLSGTSMAAPHVAGAAALVLATNPGLSPAQVASRLIGNATTGIVTDPGSGSPNRMLFTQLGTETINRWFAPGTGHWTHVGGPNFAQQLFEGWRLENPLGLVRTTQVSGTRPIYSCQVGPDHFTSVTSNCEGRTVLGRIGYVYTSPPSQPHRALYRCLSSGASRHFDSNNSACEGEIVEGRLGYVLR